VTFMPGTGALAREITRPRRTLWRAGAIVPAATPCCTAPAPVKRKLVLLAKSVVTVGSIGGATSTDGQPEMGV
jgi:hypothetical protein